MKRYTCSGCSLLCDDIVIRSDGLFIDEVVGACLRGKERFDQVTAQNRIRSPMIRKDGELKKINWEDAIKETIKIIENATNPLLYGFSNSSCEAQHTGINLAQNVNGFIDSNASICQGKVLGIVNEMGINLTTITEIINKADLLILWGANPAESIPRLLNKTLFSRGKFRMTGREIKTLVIIDPVKSASYNVMGVRDIALRIKPGSDIELIRALKEECCQADSIPSEGVAGIDQEDLKRILLHIMGTENGVIFLGQGVLKSDKNNQLIREILEFIQIINSKQVKGRISLIMMGGHYNMTGFDHVALSSTGKIGGLQFKDGELIDTKSNLVSKIANDDFDSSIIVGTDPISHLPFSLSSKLAKKPIILIDNKMTATAELADIILPTAITGIECEGLAFRLDHVPIQLEKIINPPNNLPSDEYLLEQIITELKKGGS
ncbi:MAG: formylmethanofuran dehydrogenase subunit B [Candidatus Thorarchaeota archaeon]